MTGFFEIINTSAPHIYHSALPLSPRTSIVRALYKQHALPLVRIAYGLPNSWEPSIAAAKFSSPIDTATWSPCNKLIAIARGKAKATIEILNAVTLWRLTVLNFPSGEMGHTRWLVFSPNSRLLTWSGEDPKQFISWDLQKGTLVSAISPSRPENPLSVTYSACGKMFGVLFRNDSTFTISTYDVHSGTQIYSHPVEGQALDEIWTHDERLRFAKTESGSITTWEIGFTKTDAPTEVQSFPAPSDSHRPGDLLLHPILSRFAFTAGGRVKVWSARNSKFLLDSADAKSPRQMKMTFSQDGRFFACGTSGPEFYLWKESPTGYTLHRKLSSNLVAPKPLLSPNGLSIIAFSNSAIQLWRTADFSTSSSTASTPAAPRSEKYFTLGFSPDESLAAVTRMGDKIVTVLDLKSDTPRVIIDTRMKIYGLGVGEDSIIVVGEGKIVTWNLPAGDGVLNPRANVNDSVRTATFDHPSFLPLGPRPTTSVSPDLCHVAIVDGHGIDSLLYLYDVTTGRRLTSDFNGWDMVPWFTADGRQVWRVGDSGDAELWGIVEDSESNGTRLEHLDTTLRPPDGFPWQPSRGYSVKEDLWVLSPSGKRLMWLPPHWRSGGWNRMWGGRFLAFLDRELPEPVILELEK